MWPFGLKSRAVGLKITARLSGMSLGGRELVSSRCSDTSVNGVQGWSWIDQPRAQDLGQQNASGSDSQSGRLSMAAVSPACSTSLDWVVHEGSSAHIVNHLWASAKWCVYIYICMYICVCVMFLRLCWS